MAIEVKVDSYGNEYLIRNKKRIDRQNYKKVYLDFYSNTQPFVVMQDFNDNFNIYNVCNGKYMFENPNKFILLNDNDKLKGVLFRVKGVLRILLASKKQVPHIKLFYEKYKGEQFVYGINSQDQIDVVYKSNNFKIPFNQNTALRFQKRPFLFLALDVENSNPDLLSMDLVNDYVKSFFSKMTLDLDRDSCVYKRLEKQQQSLLKKIAETVEICDDTLSKK